MALSQQDIDLIEARSELIAERVVTRVVAEVLRTHIQLCPHGRSLGNSKRLLIGIGIGIGLISSGSSAATALLIKFW